MSTTVRASARSHQVLRQVAEKRGVSMTEALDEIVRHWERRQFFEDLNDAFARLKEDPEAWADEMEERALWNQTLLDDLGDAASEAVEGEEHGR